MTETCLPPKGTREFTTHWLSREIGDGTQRQEFEAVWTGKLWQAPGIQWLSPRKAAHVGWLYVRPAQVAEQPSTVEA